MHLDRRLPYGSFGEAAYAGLQDSAPRAGLLSLHARMEGVGPSTWEHPGLAQVWGPRLAVWLIPRDAVAAFTLGRLPRDADHQRALQRLADAALAGAPDLERRAGAPTGRYLIRWDARRTRIIPTDPPDVDPEEARRDLAQRFLTWFGEGMRGHFASWAGIGDDDASETLRHVHVDHEPPVSRPVSGVRLLPLFDPYAYGRPRVRTEHPEVPGTLLVDGRAAGTWARQGRKVTVRAHPRVAPDRISAEVSLLSHPLGGPVTLHFA